MSGAVERGWLGRSAWAMKSQLTHHFCLTQDASCSSVTGHCPGEGARWRQGRGSCKGTQPPRPLPADFPALREQSVFCF